MPTCSNPLCRNTYDAALTKSRGVPDGYCCLQCSVVALAEVEIPS